jgi:hypothetical protein
MDFALVSMSALAESAVEPEDRAENLSTEAKPRPKFSNYDPKHPYACHPSTMSDAMHNGGALYRQIVPARTGSFPMPGSFPIAAHDSNGVPPWRPRSDRPQSAPSSRR